MEKKYFADGICEATTGKGDKCRNVIKFMLDNKYVCGVHNFKKKGVPLPRDPDRKTKLIIGKEDKIKAINITAEDNRAMGKRGNVIVVKKLMFGKSEIPNDYFIVEPNKNAKSTNESKLAMPQLSPMTLGPFTCGHDDDRITSQTIEGFHQGNKLFWCEIDECDDMNELISLWDERRRYHYMLEIPQRHKLGKTKAEHMKIAKMGKRDNANICAASLIELPDGKLVKYSYVQTRHFYFRYYANLARQTDEFKKLKKLLDQGYNMAICGFDGYNITKTLKEHFYDETKPFGHEIALYTLLVAEESLIDELCQIPEGTTIANLIGEGYIPVSNNINDFFIR